jgi:hypothetical protein
MSTDVSERGCDQFTVLSRNIPGEVKERRGNFQTSYTTSTSRTELGTYQIKSNLNVQ